MRLKAAALATAGMLAACGGGRASSSTASPSPVPPSVTVQARDLKDLVFTAVPRALRLDLYLPSAQAPVPVVVWVHGGGWQSGDKAIAAGHAALRQRARGYAVASIEYRLSGEATFPAQIEDCKAAVRWLRAQAAVYGLDPQRIAAWGSSAGGHLVALLGTSAGVAALESRAQGHEGQSSAVQAVVDWYGPVDFLQMDPSHLAATSPESRLLGCTVTACRDRVALANPITHIDALDPPFFIQHGSADGTVNPRQSELLHDALTAAGVPSTHVVLPGAGHGGAAFSEPANLALIEAFLDRHLK
jgi:acetyl esterase/lipase